MCIYVPIYVYTYFSGIGLFFLLTKINKVGCCNNPYHFKFTDNQGISRVRHQIITYLYRLSCVINVIYNKKST